MTDEDLIEVYPTREIYVDNFTNHTVRDGVMTCVGYRTMAEGKVVVVRLAWPVVNTRAAIGDAMQALDSPATPDHPKARKPGVH